MKHRQMLKGTHTPTDSQRERYTPSTYNSKNIYVQTLIIYMIAG